MGESFLRDGAIPSKERARRVAYRKGMRLIFLNQDVDTVRQRKRARRRQRKPREEFSFLFNGRTTLESV